MNTPSQLGRCLHTFVICVLVYLPCVSKAQATDPAELFEKLSPSVWVVVASDKNGVATSLGSGVVIGIERIVTNCHVLKKAASVLVRRENTMHAARLEFADVERDLCTLKVKGLSAPAVNIAALSSVRVGQKIIVIGAPRGFELTLSDGLISALRRNKDDVVEFIQISAPISPGSSGGGLFNMNGDLLGIPTLSRTDAQNLNFATPAEWIHDIASRSELAEVKKKEESKPVITPKSASTDSEVRRVQGDELLAVVRRAMGLGSTDANFKDGGATIDVSNVAKRSISLGPNEWGRNARFAVHPGSGELCITAAFPPVPAFGPTIYLKARIEWNYFVRCYWVYEFGPEQFALREKDTSVNAFVMDIK
jgi:serine protease Do